MKRILVVLIIALLIASCSGRKPAPMSADAPPDDVPDIVGEYAVNGFDPMGQEYGGRLTITQGANPNEYHLQWLVTGGIQEGTGVLEDNRLIVEWYSIAGSSETVRGSGIYTVTVNGELYGTRTVEGVEGEGTESLYPNPK